MKPHLALYLSPTKSIASALSALRFTHSEALAALTKKIANVIKIKRKFADCRLRTADFFCLLLIAYCLLAFTSELHPTIRYVSHTGSSTPPYTSWETAADSIQKAIDICESGDTVLVANGVYYEALYIDKTIHLIGSSMDSTIIDGTNVIDYNIVYFF